jgi:hypothetical protein
MSDTATRLIIEVYVLHKFPLHVFFLPLVFLFLYSCIKTSEHILRSFSSLNLKKKIGKHIPKVFLQGKENSENTF